MKRIRVIPVLLLKGQGLYKTVKFKNPTYLGDPINAVKIFNEKEADELCFLDITATNEKREPNYAVIRDIARECFMPLSYGGGINNFEQAKKLFDIGVEKVILSSVIHYNGALIEELANHFGSQSIVACMDVKKNVFGKYNVYSHSGRKNTKKDPLRLALELQKRGVGEIIINSIDKDGTMTGYDIDLISGIANCLDIPVVACGGASSVKDFSKAVKEGGASAVAAGSLFVFHGIHRAVLISYLTIDEIKNI